MRDHRKLRAFTLADELALSVYVETRGFPSDERFGLTSQMRRGAVSIVSNLVEGCARMTTRENLRFLEIAYASARELDYQISLASRLGFFEAGEPKVAGLAAETCRVLHGLIRSRQAASP